MNLKICHLIGDCHFNHVNICLATLQKTFAIKIHYKAILFTEYFKFGNNLFIRIFSLMSFFLNVMLC